MDTLNLGKVAVVDVECTCWEGDPPHGHFTEYDEDWGGTIQHYGPEQSEIIAVGVCLLTVPALEVSKPRTIYVRPTRSNVSEFCTQLTGITPQTLLEKGKSKVEVWHILKEEFKLSDRVWAGWGDDNVAINGQLCTALQLPLFSASYIDLCGLFSIVRGSQRRVGLMDALKTLGLEAKGQHHSAGDDAYNASQVLRKVLMDLRGCWPGDI